MRFGNDYNPLLVTVFLIVWIIVGIMEILARFCDWRRCEAGI
jgi:hypothetical protein